MATYETGGTGRNLEILKNFAYVFVLNNNQIGFEIMDISNPQQPKKVSFQALSAPPVNMVVSQGILYVTTEWTLELFDVSDPASPSILGVMDFSGGPGRHSSGGSSGVAVSGNTAYVLHPSGLIVIDVSNPHNPMVVTTYKSPDILKPSFLVAVGNFVYIGDHGGHLLVIDISNPKQPNQIAVFPMPGFSQHMTYVEDTLYVTGGPAGVLVFDVSEPKKPVLVASQSLPGRTYGVAVDGKYVYAASGESGLYILERTLTKSSARQSATTSLKLQERANVTFLPSVPVSILTSNSVQLLTSISEHRPTSDESGKQIAPKSNC